MSAIFISHSSADNEAAHACMTRLTGLGHRSVFLDFDPVRGIPAGRQWEQEIYGQMRGCQAVIVLCSAKAMASPWCFAEITFARALGKPIFPLKVEPCVVPGILDGVQITELTPDPEVGYLRLATGLQKAGIDPASVLDWNGSRAPYPGMQALLRADAAVFFGRDAEVHSVLETMNLLHRLGGARFISLLGPSGSGKSSLIRAGVVPRLERDRDRWLVAEPFRPLAGPFDALARSLSALAPGSDWKSVRRAFESDSLWRDLLNDLRVGAGSPEASLVLVVDQFEELLVDDDAGQPSTFLNFLRRIAEQEGNDTFVLLTLRSDFLGVFQSHAELQGLDHKTIELQMMTRVAQVIEGPAALAGIDLEPGLVQEIVDDVKRGSALPLLAFTLRELWDRYGAQRQFLVRHYRNELGGLSGAIGRVAGRVCHVAELAPSEAAMLRCALLRLVRIDFEGRYLRRRRPWSELPALAHGLLEKLVSARLLVSLEQPGRPRELEVAHEALFTGWPELQGWLRDQLPFLRWREVLRIDMAAWHENDRHPALLLRGPVLAKAELQQSDRAEELDADETEFIAAGIAARDAEAAARERRRRNQLAVLAGGIVFLAALAAMAFWQRQQALEQRSIARSRELAAVAEAQIQVDPERAALIAVAALDEHAEPRAESALRAALGQVQRHTLLGHGAEVATLSLSDDGRMLVSVDRSGELRLWDGDTGSPISTPFKLPGAIDVAALSGNGRQLATGGRDGVVRILDVQTGALVQELRGAASPVLSVARSSDPKVLASGHADGTVVIWNLASGAPSQRLDAWDHSDGRAAVRSLAFSADGTRIVAAGQSFYAWVWRVADGQLLARLPHTSFVSGAAIGPDGHSVVTAGGDFVRMWNVADKTAKWAFKSDEATHAVAFDSTGRNVLAAQHSGKTLVLGADAGGVERRFIGHAGSVSSIAVAANGLAATAGDDKTVRIWPAARAPAIQVFAGHLGAVTNAEFSDDGSQVVTSSADRHVRIWDVRSGKSGQPFEADTQDVVSARFSTDAGSIATAGASGSARVWTSDGRIKLDLPQQPPPVNSASFSRDAQWVVTAGHDGIVRVFSVRTGRLERELRSDGGELYAAGFSPDGRFLASGSADGRLRVWSASGGEPRSTAAHTQPLYAVAFSRDGTRIGSAGLDGNARLFDAASLTEIRSFAHAAAVFGITFSASGAFVGTAASDNRARIWEAATGRLVTEFDVGVRLRSVSFGQEERLIVTAGGDVAQIFSCETCVSGPALVQAASRRVRRVLTPDEHATYLGTSSGPISVNSQRGERP